MGPANSYIQAAEIILRNSPTPLHAKEIISQAIEARLIGPGGKTPEHSLQAAIWRDLHCRRKGKSIFVMVGRGRLNRRYWLVGKVPSGVAKKQ